MKKVEEFITDNDRFQRKEMLKLNEDCHERGLKYSTQLIALVAYHYNTTLPENGNKVLVCHGCGNSKCSNPNHMYWGTKSDNMLDDYEMGTRKSLYENMVNKHGLEIATQMLKSNSSKGGKANRVKTIKK
jgi:hypothetical protein